MPINKKPATHEDAQRIFMDAFYNNRDKVDELLSGMKHLLDIRLDLHKQKEGIHD